MKYDMTIIGAGIAGLMAAKELVAAGFSVCLIEAHPFAGGRVTTIKKPFSVPVESGAEFIHGKLPLTLKLLKEAGIAFEEIGGRMLGFRERVWDSGDHHVEHWDQLMRKLGRQKKDKTIRQFLEDNFADPQFHELREAAKRFAEGFDLADIDKASILSVKQEWHHEEQAQYRVTGGYHQLVDYLLSYCQVPNSKVLFNTTVNKIFHTRDHVEIYSNKKKIAESGKLIVTESVGVLQSGNLEFDPVPELHMNAFSQMGFGKVVKIVMEFRESFWKLSQPEIGFILSDQRIPTWWTQLPAENNILTGWAGGPQAELLSQYSAEEILGIALDSLAVIFPVSRAMISDLLLQHVVSGWNEDPNVMGGYSYSTLFTEKAVEIISEPVDQTIYFAGEALSRGESRNTVEAALQSGLAVAERIVNGS